MKQVYNLNFLISLIFTAILGFGAQAQGDNCAGAIPIPVNVGSCVFTQVSNAGLTNSGQTPVGASCTGFAGGDLWLSAVLPASGQVTFRGQAIIGLTPAAMDVNMAVYSGTCGSLSLLGCNADGGVGVFPLLTVAGTPGETVYVQLWETGNNTTGTFNFCARGIPTCTAQTVTYTPVCAGNGEFNINVNITSLGTATSIDITNNGGAPAINGVSSTGVQVVGPFALGQNVVITTVNTDDATCTTNSGSLNANALTCENILVCGDDLNQTYCYGNNDNTAFLYSSPDGSGVSLTFNSGAIQASSDFITIYDGDNNGAAVLFTGANGGNLTGVTATSTGGSMLLQVTSSATTSCASGSPGLGGGWNWDVTCEGCNAPEATFTVVEDCGADNFTVDVNITSLGNGATVSITNDGGAAAINGVSATGVQSVGPFPSGTPVEVTVSNDDFTDCDVSQGGLNFVCDDPSASCENATQINIAPLFGSSAVSADLSGVSPSGDAQCVGSNSPDLFFKFTAVSSVSYIRVTASGDFDPVVEVYNTCGGTQLECANNAPAGQREVFWVDGTVPGEEYVFRVYHGGAGVPSTTAFTAAAAHIPFVELRNDFCGATDLTTLSIIRSSSPVTFFLLQSFTWEFTELEAPFDTYEVVSPNGANPQFRMEWFPQVEYGRSYSVRIKTLQYQGPNFGDYGDACTITMAGAPIAALRPDFDNGFFNFCDIVRATQVPGTINYHWTFDDGANVFTYDSNSGSDNCPLQQVAGLQLGETYVVNVFATDGLGNESTVSIDRQINMNNFVPNTSINPATFLCGSEVPIFTVVQAIEICAPTSYTFRFTNLSQPGEPVIEHVRPNRVLKFSFVPGLIEGDTYNVAVKASSGGLSGDYSSECEVTIAEPVGFTSGDEMVQMSISDEVEMDAVAPSLELYPNPSLGNEVVVSIYDLGAEYNNLQIEIYDLSGKLMVQEQIGNTIDQFTATVNFNGQLSTGVYILRVLADGKYIAAEKLMVK